MKNLSRLCKENIRGVFLTIRVFPYYSYFSLYIPFFVLLIVHCRVSIESISLWSLVFILAHAMGFSYNTYCDYEKDPKGKNSIAAGIFKDKTVLFLAVSFGLGSILILRILNPSNLVYLLYYLYIFIWLSYSGLNLRFKESIIGPFYASIILWVGPIVLVFAYYSFLPLWVCLSVIGLFFVKSSYEISHTIGDFFQDDKTNCKTFAVRLGLKLSEKIELVLFILGIFLFSCGILISQIQFSVIYALILCVIILFYYARIYIESIPVLRNPYEEFRDYVGVFAILALNLPLITTILLCIIIFGKSLDRLFRLR